MELNINKDAVLDQYNLDKEARLLPSVIAKYQSAIKEQSELVDNLSFRLEKEEAIARQDARKALAKDGNKPTQSMVDDTVTTLESILQLRKEKASTERELAYLKACIAILDTKRRCLDNLVQLYSQEYWNSAKVDSGVSGGKYREADVHRQRSNYDSDAETEDLNSAIKRR